MVHVLFGIDRRAFAVLLLLSAIVAAARVYTALEPLERDLTTYALVAHEVLDGKPFYTGIWDNKPPGIHSVYALAELAFGYGPKAIAWLNTLTSLAVLWALFFVAGGRGNWETGCWASAFWTLLSGSLAFEANQPNTELFINLLLILGFGVVAQLRPGRRSLGLCLTAGLLVGIASLFKQVVVAWFLAVGVAYLIHHRKSPMFWRQTGTQALVVSGTVGTIWLLLYGYFAATGRGEDFIDTLFRYGLYYSGNPFQSALMGFSSGRLIPDPLGFTIPLFLIVVPTAIWSSLENSPTFRRPWFLLLGYIVACPVMIALPQRFFPHYYQLWLPVLALGLAWSIERFGPSKRRLVLGISLLAFLGFFTWRDYRLSPDAISLRKYGWQFFEIRELSKKIPLYVGEEEPLYHWGFETGYYFYSQRSPASRHLWCHYLLRGPGSEKRMRETLADLQAAKPPLVIVDIRYCVRSPVSEPFFSWLETHYENRSELPRSENARFWIRRSGPSEENPGSPAD